MGTVKNATYKVHNGTDFDEIHFKTKAAQVFCEDGKTVEEQLAEKVNKAIQTFTPTLVNGWSNAGAPYKDIIFYKDDMGIVHIEGVVKGGSIPLIFTLPAGYRPRGELCFTTSNLTGELKWGFAVVTVKGTGNVEIRATTPSSYGHFISCSFIS